MVIAILTDLIIIFGLSIVVLLFCHRLRVPTTIGLIFAGILASPHLLALVRSVHEVEILAEIGVILLLFTIGVEFSFANLLQIKRSVLLAGPAQVLGTGLAVGLLNLAGGQGWNLAIFSGFLVALSSTAIVLKLLQERGEIDTPHGRTSLGILICQDILIVPMILLVPFLSGVDQQASASPWFLLGKGVLIVALILAGAKLLMPTILFQVARTGSRELFLLTIVFIGSGVAWLTAQAGLSLALGAFVAGLIISETEYSHQTLGNILPFRDIFTSFFFISIGMLLDVPFFLANPGKILLLTSGTILLKALAAAGATLMLRYPLRTAVLVGLALAQIGEFSFILAKTGFSQGLLSETSYQIFLDLTILSMVLTPLCLKVAPRVADLINSLPWPEVLKQGRVKEAVPPLKELTDHLIIVGFGVNGRNLAQAAKAAAIPYVIIEMNPETVRRELGRGEPIFFGDATQAEVLEHAGLAQARVLVIAVNDPAATRRIVNLARQLNPSLYIIVRTRYVQELSALFELGANDVVPEEFETSVEIFSLVLNKYLVPRQEIERLVTQVRANGYLLLRGLARETPLALADLGFWPDLEIATIRLDPQAPLVGQSLAEVELRKKYQVTVLAIKREGELWLNPDPSQPLAAGDLLIILGQPQAVAEALCLFKQPGPSYCAAALTGSQPQISEKES